MQMCCCVLFSMSASCFCCICCCCRCCQDRNVEGSSRRSSASSRSFRAAKQFSRQRLTCLAALSGDGLCGFPSVVEGPCSADNFLQWFVNDIMPELGRYPCEKRCVVVVDSSIMHDIDTIEHICRSKGTIFLAIPPCSTNLNPMAHLQNHLKQSIIQHVIALGAKCLGVWSVHSHRSGL